MKKLMVILIIGLAAVHCSKNEEDGPVSLTISGVVVNHLTGEPKVGVSLSVYTVKIDDNWNATYPTLAYSTTDNQGRFEMTFKLEKSYDTPYLVVSGNPENNCSMVNGVNYNVFLHSEYYLQYGGYSNLEKNGFYRIELSTPAYARIRPPTILPGWEHAVLDLNVENIIINQFSLNDQYEWVYVGLTRKFGCDTLVHIKFTLTNGPQVRSGDYYEPIPYGDTTDIVLRLFE